MKKKVFSLMMAFVLGLFGLAQAQVSLPFTEGFEDGIGQWTKVNCYVGSSDISSSTIVNGNAIHSGNYGFQFRYTSNLPQILISPELTGGTNGVALEFWYKAYSANYQDGLEVGYSTTTNDVEAFTFGEEIYPVPTSWTLFSNTESPFPAGTKYVAFKSTRNGFYLFLDDITFTAVAGGGGGGGGVTNPLLVIQDGVEVDTIDLGTRPNGAWMRPVEGYSLWNQTGVALNMNRFDFTPEEGFFTAEADGYELPFQMAIDDTIPMLFSTNVTDSTLADVTLVRQFVAIYDARTAGVWPVKLHAYNPVCPDVFELAQWLDTIPALSGDSSIVYGPFEFTGNPDTIYDNYLLPYSDAPFFLADGKDVVYKFTVLPGQEVMLNASVTGYNGKVAVYTEDFYGEPGPMADNFYAGPILAGSDNNGGRIDDPNADNNPNASCQAVNVNRAAWDLMHSFSATTGAQYGVATDGQNIYISRWNEVGGFYKYDMMGNFIENFTISGCGQIRDLTYDGQYFYGAACTTTIYCLDLANKSLVRTIPTTYGANIRGIGYDGENDGFWIIGNWSGNLSRIDRSGAVVFTGPANPNNGVAGIACYVDDAGINHALLNTQAGTGNRCVYDYDITNNVLAADPIYDYSTLDGATGTAGGCHIANYNGKVAYFGDLQQSPNLVGIFELKSMSAAASTGTYWTPNPVIEGLTMAAGTYYLVGSATSDDFTVNIEFKALPCSEGAVAVAPLDDADDLQPVMVTLQWELGNYTTEYRLVFGSTYYCEDVLVDWTSDLAQSYNVYNLYHNTNYFWRVDTRNGNCETQGEVWGFTTTFNAPTNLHATDASIFEGESVTMEWNPIQDRTFRKYNVYLNDSLIGSTEISYLPDTYTSFVIPASLLTYNMDPGHKVEVTAYYDEGESPRSEPYYIKVSGYGKITGKVWEQDGTTGIKNARVFITGVNEFGEPVEMETLTPSNTGSYTINNVPVSGNDSSYMCYAEKQGYQGPVEPIEGNPRAVAYRGTTPANFILDEVFTPVPQCAVFAEYYPDPEDETEYVKVYWTMNGGENTNIDFENGDFSQGNFDNTVTANYPWVIATDDVHGGTYAIKSSNAGVASSTSAIEATVTLSYDGSVSFWALCRGEGTSTAWDKCIFKIDGVEKFAYGANVTGWNEYNYELTAGTHTLRWEYSKDSSVNPTGDGMWVDDIHFESAPGKGETADRSFQYYRIYRTSCFNDGPYNSDNTVLLGNNDTPADPEFIDVNFKTVGAGVYKWGVSRVYEGNREDYPNGRESEISWTCYCIDKDMYLNNVRVTVLLNSADSPEGTTVTFVNLNEVEEQNHPMGTITLDETGYYKFDNNNPFRKGTYEVTVAHDGYITEVDTVDIWSNKHLRYVLTEIIYTPKDLYVSRTGWAMWGTDDPNAGNTGGGGGGGSQGGPWEFSSNTYVTDPGAMANGADASWIKGSQSTWGPNANWSAGNGAYYLLGDSFTLDAATNINEIEVYGYQTGSTTTSTFTGLYAQIYNGNPMDGATAIWGDINTNLMTATAFTNCYRGTDGDTGGTTRPIMSVTASGLDIQLPAGTYYLVYAMTGSSSSGPWGVPHCEPGIGNTGNGVQCNTTGWTLLNDSGSSTPYGCAMKLSGNTRGENAGRHLEGYKVMCTNSFGEPIFNANTPADQPFCQVATDRLVEGQKYLFQVASIYSTGMSDYAMEVEFEYEKCDNYQDIPVQGNASAQGNTLTWNAKEGRAMWDLLGSFNAAEGGQYGIATDGVNFYTSNWGYSSATHNFYKYDLQGNMIEGFEIAGCGTLRGMAYDGQYFYGVANSNTVYCVDLANHTLVGQFTTTYGAMRCITYDPVRDGFWVVGNWSGDLTLIDRTGAILQVGPTPQSASDVAYYKDDNDVEHVLVYSQPGGSGNAVVFDYNITTNDLPAAPIFDVYNNLPGITSGSSGGAFVGEYNGKTAFFANIQQSPNLIGIFELGEGSTPTPPPTPAPEGVIGYMIFRDGAWVAELPATATSFVDQGVTDGHEYTLRVIYGGESILPSNNYNYAMSCGTDVTIGEGSCQPGNPISGAYYYESENNYGVRLSWGDMERAHIVSFNVYRSTDNANYSLISNVEAPMTSFCDHVASGTYYYQVTAVYENGCESEPAVSLEDQNVDYIQIEVTSVGNNNDKVALYPNPTSGLVKIEAAGMRHITVASVLGQVVYDTDVDANEYELNMAQWNAGVYVVRIATENGVSTQRVTVVK